MAMNFMNRQPIGLYWCVCVCFPRVNQNLKEFLPSSLTEAGGYQDVRQVVGVALWKTPLMFDFRAIGLTNCQSISFVFGSENNFSFFQRKVG